MCCREKNELLHPYTIHKGCTEILLCNKVINTGFVC
jgi:hypothetical protein